MTAFDVALRFTLGPNIEGGTSNHPADRGHLTSRGVTQALYSTWRGKHGLPTRPVTLMDDREVRALYYEEMWMPAHCDQLSDDVALCVFDAATNHGPHRAIQLLQRAVGVKDDGLFGPLTRAAVHNKRPEDVIRNYLTERQHFYADIIAHDPSQAAFKNGWSNRIAALRIELLDNGAQNA